jgi:tRNA A-37 threonylcarbamoyl transferase component Bud32
LDYLEDDHALVMEAVSGITLRARMPWIFWEGESIRSVEKACNRAGQWLRFYHELDRTKDIASLDVIRGRGVEETLNELLATQFNRTLHQQMVSFVGTFAARVSQKPRPVSHVHGDFTADNVLVEREHVTALDLGALSRNTIDHDIASFLNSLLLVRLSSPAPWSVLSRLREAFLGGYFGESVRDESAIIFLQVTGLADVALEIVARRRSVFSRMWVERIVARAIGTLAQELEKAKHGI